MKNGLIKAYWENRMVDIEETYKSGKLGAKSVDITNGSFSAEISQYKIFFYLFLVDILGGGGALGSALKWKKTICKTP